MTGAMAGARANIMVICDISFWAAAPSNRSRTMARLTTMPAPAVIPCIARQNHRCSMRVASMQPNEAAANRPTATRMTLRRPSGRKWHRATGSSRQRRTGRRTASAALRAVLRPALRRCPERTAGRRRSRTGSSADSAASRMAMPRVLRRPVSATREPPVLDGFGDVRRRTSSLPARSAMVRATFRMRCQARADRSSCALAWVSSLAPAASGWQLASTSRVVRRAFGLCWRAACLAWAASTRARTVADDSPSALLASASGGSAGTSMIRSIRSRKGPESLPR